METIQTLAETHRSLPAPRVRRGLRLAAGLALEDLAEVVGVGKATVSRWERGLREPRGEPRVRYAAALRQLREVVGRGE